MKPEIDWDRYATVHVGLSGGKDSAAAWLWLLHESGCPREKIIGSMCDTENEDRLTYGFVDLLAQQHPITILRTKGFLELAKSKKRFPSRKVRFCTEALKIVPSIHYVLSLPQPVLCVSGIRRAEAHASNQRGAMLEVEWAPDYHADQFRPLLHDSIEEVWRLHRAHLSMADVVRIVFEDAELLPEHRAEIAQRLIGGGTPMNPLYVMGADRVGCFPCINSKKNELRAAQKYRPHTIDKLRDWETEVGTTFFAPNTVPPRYRSQPVTTKKCKVVYCCTIDDVVRWAKTGKGARTLALDFDLLPACVIGGHCE